MSIETELRKIQKKGEDRDLRYRLLAAKKLLAGALCAHCGEPLGEETPTQVERTGSDPRTVHQSCEVDAERALEAGL